MMLDNPHASPLAHLVLESWAVMVERFGRDAIGGALSVPQVGRYLGARSFNGEPVAPSRSSASYRCIAMTLGWLSRQGYLTKLTVGKRTRYAYVGTPPAISSGMSGQLHSLPVIAQFFQPELNSTTLTLVSKKTGTRFTYDVKRKEPNADGHADEVWYVDLLTGPDNRKDFSALAVLTKRDGRLTYFHAKKSRIGADAPSAVAFKWAVEQLVIRGSETALAQIEVWHEGRCGRCGRKLSVPTSIELGLGPECASKV